MDELQPNPDRCIGFQPNPFKKEKCKDCGRIWVEHKGLISEETVQGYVRAREKVAADKLRGEEEVKAKADAKKLAKRRQEMAEADKWFYDQEDPQLDSEDDDNGFRMFESGSLPRNEVPTPAAARNLKIVNLIDFGECDVADSASEPAWVSAPESAAPAWEPQPPPEPAWEPPRQSFVPEPSQEEELLSEIQHLRQMLADANEEKNIQVAIIRDDVAEKQQQLDEALRQHTDVEASLCSAREEIARLASQQEEARETSSRLAGAEASLRTAREEIRAYEMEGERARAESELAASREVEAEHLPAPPAIVSLVTEMRLICVNTRHMLDGVECSSPQPHIGNLRDVEVGLQGIKSSLVHVQALCERTKKPTSHMCAAKALRELRLDADKQFKFLRERMVQVKNQEQLALRRQAVSTDDEDIADGGLFGRYP